MNNVVLIGNLTRDAEIVDFKNGNSRAIKFTLAVQRNFKNKDGEKEVDFIPIIYFISHADKLIDYLTKGKLLSVSGRIHVHSVEGEDGKKKYYTNIQADSIKFLDTSKSNAQ